MPSHYYSWGDYNNHTLVASVPISKTWVVSLWNNLMPMKDYLKIYSTLKLPLLYWTDSTLLFKISTTSHRFLLDDNYNIRYYIDYFGSNTTMTIIFNPNDKIIYDNVHSKIETLCMSPMLWVNLKE